MNFHTLKQYLGNNLWYGENGTLRRLDRDTIIYSLVMPDTTRIWGIDISHWNLPPVALKRMMDIYGLRFVIIKGCDGSLRSRYSADHVAVAKEAGIPFGLYDWLYPNSKVSIAAQTDAWVAQAKEHNPPMGIFIDAEWTNYGGLPANPSATDLRTAHDMVLNKYRESATTYTAKGYADQYLRGFDFNKEELWVASYGGTQPLMPSGALRYKFWQFTSTLDGRTLDPNGNAELDGNYYNGTEEEFVARYGQQTQPAPPANGGTMPYYDIVGNSLTTNRTIRSGPVITEGWVASLIAGNHGKGRVDDVKVYTDNFYVNGILRAYAGDRWIHVYENNGVPVNGWIAEIHLGVRYINLTLVNDTTPPTELPESWDVTQVAKDANGNIIATYTGTLTKQ